MMRTVDHAASILLVKYTRVVPIQKESLPVYHFNFLPYDLLHTRTDQRNILTDYIGCLVGINPSDDVEDMKRTYLALKDNSNRSVTVTLWPEIRKTFNHSEVENTVPPVVIAVTSTKVGNFIRGTGDMQLNSTPATSVFVNPPIPELKDLKNSDNR